MNYFQTSCNFTSATPDISKTVFKHVQNAYGLKLNGCCLKFQNFSKEDVVYYLCQNCRMQLEQATEATLLSFYLLLDQDENFPWPDYHEKAFYLQDCFRDKEHPEIHKAVRNILQKMNIQVLELEKNKEHSDFCGTLFYEGKRCMGWDEEKKKTTMEQYVSHFGDIPVITYCNRCRKDILLGGHEAFHILELIFKKAD